MVELKLLELHRTFIHGTMSVEALRNLSLHVQRGSFTAIVGPSGCGKTTLLRIIAGLDSASSGEIRFQNGTAKENPRIGFMFQDSRLLPWLTVEANLRLAFTLKDPDRDSMIDRVLELVGIERRKKSYPRELSGGMAQRVALARALCRKPDLLLLDEPFGALDAITRTKLRKDLEELWRKIRITVLHVTHDIEEAVYLADRVLIMRDGSIQGDVPVSLERPRNRRCAEFQMICQQVDEAMQYQHKDSR